MPMRVGAARAQKKPDSMRASKWEKGINLGHPEGGIELNEGKARGGERKKGPMSKHRIKRNQGSLTGGRPRRTGGKVRLTKEDKRERKQVRKGSRRTREGVQAEKDQISEILRHRKGVVVALKKVPVIRAVCKKGEKTVKREAWEQGGDIAEKKSGAKVGR